MRVDDAINGAGTSLPPAASTQRGDRELTLAEQRVADATLNALGRRSGRLKAANGAVLAAIELVDAAGIGSQAMGLLKECQQLTRLRQALERRLDRHQELLHLAASRLLSTDERAELLQAVMPEGETPRAA